MKKIILTLLLGGLTYFCQAQNSFPSPGPADVTINTTVPANHGSGYNALWMPNAGALMPENSPAYAGIMLTSNVARSPTAGNWSFVNSAFPAWKLYLGYGSTTDFFYIGRSAPSIYAEQIYFKIANNGNVGIGTPSPAFRLDVQGGNASVYNTGATSTLSIGSVASGKTNLVLSTSADAGGYGIIQSIAAAGSLYGNTVINPTAGNVLIGQTLQKNSSYILDVAGSVRAKQITVNSDGADFVFEPTYSLLSLSDLKRYIDQNHHLPDIESAKQMQTDGLNLGDNQTKLLQKIEELTLYLIEQDNLFKKQTLDNNTINLGLQEQITNQKVQLENQEERLKSMEEVINKLTKGSN